MPPCTGPQRAKHRELTGEEVKLLVYELLTDAQIERFEREGQIDCAYTLESVARFRIHLFKKFPGMGAAFRIIPHEIPTLDGLGMPEVLKNMLHHRSGLILITGPTNSGKSTTLAAMVDYLNERNRYHILTLEDLNGARRILRFLLGLLVPRPGPGPVPGPEDRAHRADPRQG